MGRVIWSLGFTSRREDERIRQEVNQEEFLGGWVGHEDGGDERELT